MKTLFISMLAIILIVYIGMGLYIYINQRSLIYYPVGSAHAAFGEEEFINNNESIKVTVLNKEKKHAIIYFGGNAEAVDSSSLNFSMAFPEHALFLVKYRGYGGSTGVPTEEGIYSDALNIYDKILPQYHSVSVVGRSLGSGVATLVASERKLHKLVLVTPFDSIQNVAQKQFPFYPMSILLKDKYDSVGRIPSIKAKTLVVIAESDEIIGREHSNRLIEKFPASQVIFESIKDQGHNSISNSKRYYNLISEFLSIKK